MVLLTENVQDFINNIYTEQLCQADLEIVGQPVSEADRKLLTLQKVLGASSFLSKLFLKVLKTMIISARKYDMS